jgi:hypothetical protein
VFPVIADVSEAANREDATLEIKWEFRTPPFLGAASNEDGDG